MFRKVVLIAGAALLGGAVSLWVASSGYPDALDVTPESARITRIDNVNIVSMVPGAPEIQTGLSVLVKDGHILAIDAPDAIPISSDDRAIDGGGQMLLPGLIDAHVHIWDEAELATYLAHGVTSVRNMSGLPFHLEMQDRIASARMLGPDLVTTGRILNSPGPNAHSSHGSSRQPTRRVPPCVRNTPLVFAF